MGDAEAFDLDREILADVDTGGQKEGENPDRHMTLPHGLTSRGPERRLDELEIRQPDGAPAEGLRQVVGQPLERRPPDGIAASMSEEEEARRHDPRMYPFEAEMDLSERFLRFIGRRVNPNHREATPMLPHLHRTRREEVVNAATHATGLLASLLCVIALVELALEGDLRRLLAATVYGSTLIAVYASSTAYHAVDSPRTKRRLRALDQCVIYLLIAGSYTPVLLVALPDPWSFAGLMMVWSLAAAGIALRLGLRQRWERFSTPAYLVLGWGVVLLLPALYPFLGPHATAWLMLGGVAFTIGAWFCARSRPFMHTVWHGFVLIGTACHFWLIFRYVLGG